MTDLDIHFQPIVSLRTGGCWAVEALAREGRRFPAALFHAARQDGTLPALDARCRELALQRFSSQPAAIDLTLSVNWTVECATEASAERFSAAVAALGIRTSHVAIEIVEGAAPDAAALEAFVQARKREGYLISVDDFGAGQSSIERLVRLEPDVVKLDRSITHGASRTRTAAEVCRAIAELCRSIGALVVAEGVEDEADVVELAMMGIDLFQGFVVARAHADIATALHKAQPALERTRPLLRTCADHQLALRRRMQQEHEHVLVGVASRIAHARVDELDTICGELLLRHPTVEAIYVLDERGVQRTRTWLRPELVPRSGFRPADPGADLGLKDYYLEVSSGASTFASRPYLSMASGRLTVTYSRRVRITDGSTVIVCCDVPSQPDDL